VNQMELPEFAALLHEFKHGIAPTWLGCRATIPGPSPSSSASTSATRSWSCRASARSCSSRPKRPAAASPTPATELRADAARLARVAVETPLVTHRLDAVVAVTASPAWLTDYVLGDHSVFHTAAPPRRRLPVGVTAVRLCVGLPVGISFMGPRWSEARLIALAYAFEQAAAAPSAARRPARQHRQSAAPGRDPGA